MLKSSILLISHPFKRFSPFVLLMILLVSCEQDAHVKLPPVKEKLVINSFISPQDSILKVFVGKSTPVFGTKNPNQQNEGVRDGKVTISDGINTIQLEYDINERKYVSKKNELLIETGKEYFLEVTALGQTVKASCIIPDPTPISALKLDTIEQTIEDYHTFTLVQVRADWTDLFQWKNYYRIYGEVEFENPTYQQDPDTKYLIFVFENDVASDAEGSSGNFSRKAQADIHLVTDAQYTNKVTRIHVYLITSDKNYFTYHDWYNNNNEDNPFAEPTLVPTNIKDGLGVFAAYNKTHFVIEVE